jgi:hypothetical protein
VAMEGLPPRRTQHPSCYPRQLSTNPGEAKAGPKPKAQRPYFLPLTLLRLATAAQQLAAIPATAVRPSVYLQRRYGGGGGRGAPVHTANALEFRSGYYLLLPFLFCRGFVSHVMSLFSRFSEVHSCSKVVRVCTEAVQQEAKAPAAQRLPSTDARYSQDAGP